MTYSWAFGDGAVQNGPAMFVQHAFDSPGFHNVTVEAANGAGAVSGHTAIDVEQSEHGHTCIAVPLGTGLQTVHVLTTRYT